MVKKIIANDLSEGLQWLLTFLSASIFLLIILMGILLYNQHYLEDHLDNVARWECHNESVTLIYDDEVDWFFEEGGEYLYPEWKVVNSGKGYNKDGDNIYFVIKQKEACEII